MEVSIKYEDLQLDKICRICLLQQESLSFISKLVSEKLTECASVELPSENCLICNVCENEINKWFSFKQQVMKALEITKTLSENITSKTSPSSENGMKQEIKLDTDENRGYRHKCSKCIQTFPTYGKLRTHLKAHNVEEGYTCDLCAKVFHSAQCLWRHKRRHGDKKPYPCQKCPMTFPFKHALDRHFQAKHVSEATFLCSFCPKMYKVRDTLVAHVRKSHSGERSGAVCNVCGKFCVSVASLKVHLRSHTGERPFVCDVCKKGFVTKDHMTLHRRIHTGERPYVCGDCGKEFISSSVLVKHKRSHTGERPYTCHLCNKTFGLSSAFKRHLKCH